MIPPKKKLFVAFTIYTLPKKKQRRAQQYLNETALLCTKEAMHIYFQQSHQSKELITMENLLI